MGVIRVKRGMADDQQRPARSDGVESARVAWSPGECSNAGYSTDTRS